MKKITLFLLSLFGCANFVLYAPEELSPRVFSLSGSSLSSPTSARSFLPPMSRYREDFRCSSLSLTMARESFNLAFANQGRSYFAKRAMVAWGSMVSLWTSIVDVHRAILRKGHRTIDEVVDKHYLSIQTAAKNLQDVNGILSQCIGHRNLSDSEVMEFEIIKLATESAGFAIEAMFGSSQ